MASRSIITARAAADTTKPLLKNPFGGVSDISILVQIFQWVDGECLDCLQEFCYKEINVTSGPIKEFYHHGDANYDFFTGLKMKKS